jgi:hypothetical protein
LPPYFGGIVVVFSASDEESGQGCLSYGSGQGCPAYFEELHGGGIEINPDTAVGH